MDNISKLEIPKHQLKGWKSDAESDTQIKRVAIFKSEAFYDN